MTLEKASAKLRARDVNVPSAASGLEGGPAAKRARVAESETIARHKKFFKLREENVTGFGPCAQGLRGNFYVHVAGKTQPRLVRGDVEAKLELREFMLEPRHEHASYNARDSGKHEVRSVGVCGQRDDSVMKILGKTFAWTREENVGRAANDDADVIVVPSKAVALDFLLQRKKHYSRELSGTDISVPDNFMRCFIVKLGHGSVRFTLRSKTSNQAKAACKRIAVNDSHWHGIQERAKTTIVYDKFAYASRPNPVRGPAVLTSGREAVEFAKRWIDERRREVSEYLKANVNTLKEVYRVLEMSPGLGDQPKDGYWNAPAHDRSARVFVEEEAGDDATTTVDKDMNNDGLMNSYSARTKKKSSLRRSWRLSQTC